MFRLDGGDFGPFGVDLYYGADAGDLYSVAVDSVGVC